MMSYLSTTRAYRRRKMNWLKKVKSIVTEKDDLTKMVVDLEAWLNVSDSRS